jgi:protein-S-isoprenylcysteine O-methyltransferase Ste14
MEINNENKTKEKYPSAGIVHFLLFHSYVLYLIAVVLGAILDNTFSIEISNKQIYPIVGFLMMVSGTFLILWIQISSPKSRKSRYENPSVESFEFGAYKYFLNPIHFGLFIMTIGLALVMNSFISVLLVLIFHLIIKFTLLKKQEVILSERYGQAYIEHRKKFKDWI